MLRGRGREGERGWNISHGVAILILGVASLAVFLILLGNGDPVDMMELFNLVPVREAVRDGHWLMPTLNGLPRLEKPPLPVWLPAGLAVLLRSESLWVLRMPSVVMGLMTVLATYGMGCVLFRNEGDRPGGGGAVLCAGGGAVFAGDADVQPGSAAGVV